MSRLRASQLDGIVLVVASLAGATAWISLGALAVTSDRLARLGVLPPLWTLPVLVIGAALAAIGLRLRRAAAWPLLSTLVLWLPWLPLGVAPAFLIWEGPLEAVVWVAALTGVAAASIPATLRKRWAPTLTAPRGAAAFAAVALVGSLAAAAVLARTGRIPGGDEPHYLIITQSLLNDGDLRIQNNHDRGDYSAYFQNGLPPDFLQRGVDGQIYSVHAPGISMLLAPAFALGGYPAAVLVVALVSAVGLALAWYAAFSLTGSAAASWMSGLAVLLSGTVFFHSFAIFPDPIGGAIVAAILLLIVRMHVAGEEIRRWHVTMAGALLAMMPWLHTRFAFISAAAALVIAGRLWRRADRLETLGAFAAAPLISSAAWFGYFYAIYGTPNPAAPYGDSQQNALAWIGTGLTGLSVDQQFGVLAGAPVIAFVPFGLVVLSRLAPRLVVELLLIALPYVLVVASFGMWWGGWSAPARFLDCLMPLAVPALAFAWLGAGRARRGVFVAAVLVAAANVVARLTVLDGALLYNNRDGFDLLFDWISRNVNVPLGLPSVHRSGAQVGVAVDARLDGGDRDRTGVAVAAGRAREDPGSAVGVDERGDVPRRDRRSHDRVAVDRRGRADARVLAGRRHSPLEPRMASARGAVAGRPLARPERRDRDARAAVVSEVERGHESATAAGDPLGAGGRLSGGDRGRVAAGWSAHRLGRDDLAAGRDVAARTGERGHHTVSRPAAGTGAFGRDPRRRVGRQAHRPHVAAAGADRTVDGHVTRVHPPRLAIWNRHCVLPGR